MSDLTLDLIREHCSVHIGVTLSSVQARVLLAVYNSGAGISLSRMGLLLCLPQAAVSGAVASLSRLRVRMTADKRSGEEFGLIRTELSAQTSDAVQVFLTKEGHTFTKGMLRAITGPN